MTLDFLWFTKDPLRVRLVDAGFRATLGGTVQKGDWAILQFSFLKMNSGQESDCWDLPNFVNIHELFLRAHDFPKFDHLLICLSWPRHFLGFIWEPFFDLELLLKCRLPQFLRHLWDGSHVIWVRDLDVKMWRTSMHSYFEKMILGHQRISPENILYDDASFEPVWITTFSRIRMLSQLIRGAYLYV